MTDVNYYVDYLMDKTQRLDDRIDIIEYELKELTAELEDLTQERDDSYRILYTLNKLNDIPIKEKDPAK